jgi:hypothetical protein
MSTGNYPGEYHASIVVLSGSEHVYMSVSSTALVASYDMGIDTDMKGEDRGSAHQNSSTMGYS